VTPDAQVVLGPRTGATCPTPAVTYADFGQAFFAAYCTRCHASTVTGADRNGAPADHNYETVEGVRAFMVEIDEVAASGPNATNDAMPFLGSEPSLAERQLLGQLLACGVPD
jgi:cytochrome c5